MYKFKNKTSSVLISIAFLLFFGLSSKYIVSLAEHDSFDN